MKKPIFSIVIPVYNAEKTIRRCVESVMGQTFSDYEAIIIDDGSTDNSSAILHEYQSRDHDHRLKVLRQDNVGAGMTRNRGIDIGTGEYLVFLDADDYIDAAYLEKIYEQVERNHADIVFVDIVREKENGDIVRYERMSDFSRLDRESMIRQQLTGKMPWGGVRKAARYSLVRMGGFRFGALKTGEESVYSFELLRHAKNIAFQTEALYHYVDTGTSLTANDQVENCINVFHYLMDHLSRTDAYARYKDTMNAMAATTTVIAINVLAKQSSFFHALRRSHEVYRTYKAYIRDSVDKLALEKRVLLCLPLLKAGVLSPIILVAKARMLKRGRSKK